MVDIDQIIDKNVLAFVDKYVTLQYFKEKKTSRTYIVGLEGFMKPEDIDSFVFGIKKKLGTAFLKKHDDNLGSMFGFNGDHRTRIQELLISAKIPADKIKMSNS